jgi:hypothetical protein
LRLLRTSLFVCAFFFLLYISFTIQKINIFSYAH